jgi:hypothetical protein
MRSVCFSSLLLVCLVSVGHAAGKVSPEIAGVHEAKPEGVGPAVVITPDKGFVGDAFAFDEGGTRLAWVQTDTEGLCTIHLADPATGKDAAVINLAPAFARVTELRFVRSGSALLVIGEAAIGHPRSAVVGTDGKVQHTWDKVSAEYAKIGATEIIVDWQPASAGDTYKGKVRAFDLATGKPYGKPFRVTLGKNGTVGKLGLAPLFWQDGHRTLYGKKEGAFDKQGDQRLPETFAAYDVLGGKFIKDEVITDLPAFTRLVELRAKHPGQPVILWFNPDNVFELVTADDRQLPVQTVEPIRHYLPASLSVADDVHAFTLTIDPVNADAVKAQKADPIHLDLYTIDPRTGVTRRLCRVVGGGEVRWQHAGHAFAVLHKHKGFDRGGPKLEIYPITGK